MGIADDIINGKYQSGTNAYKKKKKKDESIADQIINGTYQDGLAAPIGIETGFSDDIAPVKKKEEEDDSFWSNFLTDAKVIGSNLLDSANAGILQFGKTIGMRNDEFKNATNDSFNDLNRIMIENQTKKGATPEEIQRLEELYIRDNVDSKPFYQEKIDKINQRMVENTEKATNPVSKKIAGLSQSIGNTLVGMGVSAINPMAGTTYFVGSATGSGYDEGIERGMTDEEARMYGGTIGAFEGLVDKYLAGQNIKGFKAILEGQGFKNALKAFGIEVFENFVQEAVMPSLSELTAATTAGTEHLNYDFATAEGWKNLGKDSLRDGIDGALSAILINGTTKTVASATRVVNKINNGQEVTQEEIATAVKDSQKAGVDVEGILQSELTRAAEQGLIKNQAQIEGLQQEIAKKTEELNKSQDVREKQIIQETINGLNEELNELTNAQQITEQTVENKTEINTRQKIQDYINKNNLDMTVKEFEDRFKNIELEAIDNMTPEQQELFDLITEIKNNDTQELIDGSETPIVNQPTIDNKGRTLSKEQQERYKDNKAIDKDGNLVTLYHATGADFDTFDLERAGQNFGGWSQYGKAIYLTSDKEKAKTWAAEGGIPDVDVKIKEVYGNIKNPFDLGADYNETLSDIKEQYNIDEFVMRKGYRVIEMLDELGLDIAQILTSHGYDGIIDGDQYVVYGENQVKYVDNYRPTDSKDMRYSVSEDTLNDMEDNSEANAIDRQINQTMTMEEAKDMIQRAFGIGDIYNWFDGQYKNGDEWLAGEGSDSVALVIENEYQLQQKFLDKMEGLNDDYVLEDVLEAYINGTLTGKQKENTTSRLDLTTDTGFIDDKFYSPKGLTADLETYRTANQRVTKANREAVYKARADFITNAHNKGYIESLGLTQAEVNKKLRTWANYPKKAIDYSNYFNEGVSTQNRWTGIENSSILNTITISDQDLSNMVKEIKGNSDEWQRRYVTSTMLALDTHINYKELTYEFNSDMGGKRNSVLGDYSASNKTIRIRTDGQNTVAHETGHYIDNIWGEEIFGRGSLTDKNSIERLQDAEVKQWVTNFYNFLDNIENSSDIRNGYTMSSNEVFARFVARFVEWTKNVATSNRYGYESKFYRDNFTESQYREFVKLLQEKAKLDTTKSDIYKQDIIKTDKVLDDRIDDIYNQLFSEKQVKKQIEEALIPLQETINNLSEQLETVLNSSQSNVENIDTAPVSQEENEKQRQEDFANLPESEMPSEINEEDFAPIEDTYEDVESPVQERDIDEVGNRKVKAYQYEHPEVRPYFQVEADNMLGELSRRIEGERYAITDQDGYTTEWAGVSRQIPEDIAYLKDNYGYSYEQIEKGLKAIIEDNGAENNAVSKRLEILIDERLTNGYVDFLEGYPIPPNQEYKNLLIENDATDYYSNLAKTLDDTDIAPEQATMNVEPELKASEQVMPIAEKTAQKGNTELTDTSVEKQREERVAKIMAEAPTPQNRKQRQWAKFVMNFVSKGSPFEDLSLKTNNRELMGKWDSMLTSAAKAQNTMLNGIRRIDALNNVEEQVSKSLDDIRTKVVNSDKVEEFYEYMYHALNVDRMSLEKNAQAKVQQMLEENPILKELNRRNTIANIEARLQENATQVTFEEILNDELLKKNNDIFSSKELRREEAEDLFNKVRELIKLNKTKNKPVFGDSVTAEASQKAVEEFEMDHPEFTEWAKDVYQYNNALRDLMVENNIISQETADLFAEMYPHYVPIKRVDVMGNAINVPLDTNRTSVNTPIKRAKGGNQDILPMFDTMASRTLQTYKAISKNNFGIELKNTLKSTIDTQETNLDDILDNVDQQESLLQEGKDGQGPTFTVFENGDKVTYEITQDMYDALKPISDSSILSETNKFANSISNFHRGVLTEYNPVFMLTNAIKDAQDILMNSQHAAKTYAKLGESYAQILKKGMWYKEYMANGGEQNSFFDSQDGTYGKESIADKILPLKAISKLNNIIELSPRLAEYIASRESGRSIETSMLDAARVTTNFKDGGDITKWLNRNGATFLNASIQGAAQQVRNVREAHTNGLKGYANLATKFALAGVPAMILNSLLWGDDEEYEELSDYVKTNYWILGKYGDGNFIRIPKGRMITVIQESFNQMKHLITGDEQADLNSFLEVLGNNIAPNNPVSDNILSPIVQAVTNKTWYGGDLVPTRLQDVPAAEQYDESIDNLSVAIGQKTGISPYKINYVLDQYSGGIGDVFLPMMTPQAEGGKDDLASNLLAPLVNKFSVDSSMKNQSVSDLYELSDELTTKANSSKATDEDILKNKFVDSVKTGMNELYKKKREIQNSDLPDSEKYEQVREIQEQINYMAKAATRDYEDMDVRSNYADVGGIEYYKNNDGEWTKVREEEASELNELGMSYSTKNTYFKAKNEISAIVGDTKELKEQLGIEDEDSDEYKEAVSSLNSDKKEEIVEKVIGSGLNDREKAYLYKKFYNSDTIDTMVETGISVDDYLVYTTKEFKADYNNKGKAISGSRKEKVEDYVFSIDGLNTAQKAILIKSTNTFKYNDYNVEIVRYLDNLGLEYDDFVSILNDLDMTVKGDMVYWD